MYKYKGGMHYCELLLLNLLYSYIVMYVYTYIIHNMFVNSKLTLMI